MAFTTRKSLLAKVRSGDQIAWEEFYAAYKPLIYLVGGDHGLTYDEKEELVQKVMCEIFQKDIVGKYDPETPPENFVFQYDPSKGRFKYFLRRIVHYQAIRIFHQRKGYISLDDDNAPQIPDEPMDAAWEASWDAEWKKHILNMALMELKERVQPDTFVAFEMYAMQNRPVEQVAEFLDISVSSVYTAKSRCITALKSIIKDLEEK